MRSVSTISDVAAGAGVTKTTVSMVLRNKPGVSKSTRDRIFKVIQDLNYRPAATRQTQGSVLYGQIGVLLLSGEMPRTGREPGGSYLHTIIDGCLAQAEHEGNSLAISRMTLAQLAAGALPMAFKRQHLDGVVIRGWLTDEVKQWLAQLQMPFVLLDCNQHVPGAAQVQIENSQAMELLVGHLVDRGATRIATITGDMDHLNAQERLAGLYAALVRRNLSLESENVVIEKGFDEESGRRGARTLRDRGSSFDALVCQNDLIAMGALEILSEQGLKVPRDVRVAGFDNMELGERLPTQLTTIDPQVFKMGQTGVQMLLEQFRTAKPNTVHQRVPVELVIRDST